ncbi:MAG TPA: SOS response-associated peptidase [Candidatus Limnocylindria bacterium]|nr:SOS response-associated peptidase [Candidatus Limnocylindria bacterium]
MCGRFSQGEPSHRISDYFGADPDEDLPDGLWNVPPTEAIRIVVARDGQRRLTAARWGFQPFWADGTREAPARSWINARSETAWDSTAFGPALRAARCIVPADAFYEWDRSVSPRQPYAIGPARDGELLAMAGIWSATRHAPPTVAILTTAPNDLVAPIHDRMPVILPLDLVEDWLAADASPADLAPMLAPAPDTSLRIWPVSTAVNRVQADGPDLLRPIELPQTLGLV